MLFKPYFFRRSEDVDLNGQEQKKYYNLYKPVTGKNVTAKSHESHKLHKGTNVTARRDEFYTSYNGKPFCHFSHFVILVILCCRKH